MKRLEIALGRNRAARAVWREVYRVVELRRKSLIAETRREAWLGANVSLKQAELVFGAVQNLIMQEPPETQRRMALGLRRLLHAHFGAPQLPSGQAVEVSAEVVDG